MRQGLAILVSGWLLVLLAASAHPGLHEWLHDAAGDAHHGCATNGCGDGRDPGPADGAEDDAPHVCAVTLFSQGWLGMAANAPDVGPVANAVPAALSEPVCPVSEPPGLLRKARAPPRA